MTIELDPIDMTETDEERQRREALESLAAIGPSAPVAQQHAQPPAQASVLDQGVPPPPPGGQQPTGVQQRILGRQQAQATQLGDRFRAGQMPSAPAQMPRGAAPDSPMRVYPPGVLPPPNPEMSRSVDERFGFAPPAGEAPLPPAGGADVPPQAPPLPPPGDARTVARAQQEAQGLGRALGAPQGEPSRPTGVRDEFRRAAQARGVKPPGNPAPDYTGVDVADAFRRPLHNLANAFRVMGGRPANREFRSEGADARARDRLAADTKDRRAEQQDERAADERQMSLRERAQASIEEDRSQRNTRLQAQSEALERYREESNRIRAMQAEGVLTAQQAAAAERVARTALLEARNDPNSEASQRARQRLDQLVSMRAQSTNRPELDVDSEGMAAADVERLETGLGQMRSPVAPQRRVGQGGGQGGNRAPDTLVDDAVALGIPRGTAEAMARESAQSRRALMQRIATESEQRAREGGANRAAIAAAEDATRAMREAMPPEGQDIPGIGRLDSLRGEGFFQSSEGVRMRTLASNMVRRYLRLESGAAISDEEMASEMRLRGLGPGATEEQFRRGVDDLERDLRARIDASRPQAERAAPRAQQRPAQGGTVNVRSPSGEVRPVLRAVWDRNRQQREAEGFQAVD